MGLVKGIGNALKAVLKIIFAILLLLAVAVAILAVLYASGVKERVQNLSRVDEEGHLYYAEYAGDYEIPLIETPMRLLGEIGCTSFVTYDSDSGDVLTGRNYDYLHVDPSGNATGLNVVVRLQPEGKYSSLNMADLAIFTQLGFPYYAGVLDDGKTTQIPMTFLPYLCLDGVNDQGLAAVIHSVAVKDGEETTYQETEGKENCTFNMLLRSCLDNCKNVEEAISFAEQYNLRAALGIECHIFLTDASGASAVLEWRDNTMSVIRQDIVTNFHVGSDDGQDYYKDGKLMDKFVTAEGIRQTYSYGYGFGYDRFARVAETLDDHIVSRNPYRTELSVTEVRDLLEDVSVPYNPGGDICYTQYSIIYDNTLRNMTIWSDMDYTKSYGFSLKP